MQIREILAYCLKVLSTVFCGTAVDHLAAGYSKLRRIAAEDKPLAGDRHNRGLKPYLRETTFARGDLARVVQYLYSRQCLYRPDVNTHTLTCPQRFWRTRQNFDLGIKNLSGT